MRLGTKLKCVDAKGMDHWIRNGCVYTFSGFSHEGKLYMVRETGDVGYFPWRFRVEDDGFDRFMERVKKPVDLGKPVSA